MHRGEVLNRSHSHRSVGAAATVICVLLSVMACSSGTAKGAAASSGRLQNPPSGGPMQPTPDTAGLNCTIPVVLSGPYDAATQHYGAPRGGFVTFPAGTVREDPAGGMEYGAPTDARITTVAKPTLHGSGAMTFDSTARRWVPTSTALVSPDGSAYTYAEGLTFDLNSPTHIWVVTVKTAADRVVYSGGATYVPIKFAAEGIYVVQARFESSSVGLQLLDPRTGIMRVLATTGDWNFISAGAAWGIDADISGLPFNPHRVDRLDLATGVVTTWYEALEPRSVSALGLDANGRLIVGVYSDANGTQVADVNRMLGPAMSERLFTSHDPFVNPGHFLADAHGIWFGSVVEGGRLWLYSDGVGLRLVADTHRLPVSGVTIDSAAGACR